MSEVVYQSESADRAWLERLPHAPARYAAGVLALAGLYYAGAKTGYLLEFSGPVAAIVWLPVGIGIAFLYLGGLAYWPGVLIGDLLANDYSVLPLGSALGQTCGNVLEVVIAALLLAAPRPARLAARQRRAASARSRSRSRQARPSARRSARPRCSPAA